MIVLTWTRPWLLVGYRFLARKYASSGLVRGIGEAVTQAPAGAAFGQLGLTDGRGAGPNAHPTLVTGARSPARLAGPAI